jgi:hypothetical protein
VHERTFDPDTMANTMRKSLTITSPADDVASGNIHTSSGNVLTHLID